jgi:hypothetical protein
VVIFMAQPHYPFEESFSYAFIGCLLDPSVDPNDVEKGTFLILPGHMCLCVTWKRLMTVLCTSGCYQHLISRRELSPVHKSALCIFVQKRSQHPPINLAHGDRSHYSCLYRFRVRDGLTVAISRHRFCDIAYRRLVG